MTDIEKQVLKLNMKLISYRPFIYVLNFFIWLSISLVPLLSGLLTRAVFLQLELGVQTNYIILCSLISIVGFILGGLIWFGGITDTRSKFYIGQLARKNLVIEIIKNPLLSIKSEGEAIDIIDKDIGALEELVTVQIDVLCRLIFAGVAVTLLLSISVELTILALIPLIIITYTITLIGEKIKRKHSNSRQSHIEYSILLSDIINNRETIQLLGCENDIIKTFVNISVQRKEEAIKQKLFHKTIYETTTLVSSLSIGIILFMAAKLIIKGELLVGDLSLFIGYFGYASGYTELFTEFFCSFKYAENTVERIAKITNLKYKDVVKKLTENKLNNNYPKSIFDEKFITNEGLKYKNVNIPRLNLSSVNFEILPKQIFAISGKTGSGKSTFINCILGYEEYTGKITYGEMDIKDIRNYIALIPQEPKFLNETIQENISLSLNNDDISKYIRMSNLSDDLLSWEKAGNTKIGINGKNLSDGQRQRLAIARGLAHCSDILILDDPMSFLDKNNVKCILKNIKNLGLTTILVSNSKLALDIADKVMVLDKGQIISLGNKEELLKNCEVLKEIYYSK